MAELEQKQTGKKGKKKGRKKMSTRIDLTPMVDLGFLLITFFMLTTTFSKPQTMEINLPVKPKEEVPDEEQNAVKASNALTLILDEYNKIFWYVGIPGDENTPKETNFSSDGVRKILRDAKGGYLPELKHPSEMVVLIKPSDKSIYKNVVDILDEMNISDIKRYALVDISPVDLELIKNL
jgi:biopolymer transport protein ExbD